MVIFISSIRRGLEEERDSLPAMISALGHTPSRFEDFTALPVPPRQACLDGVAAADLYLLLLGERYGDPLPDTGQSSTEEEFNAAEKKGIAIIVLRKKGVGMEEEQVRFSQRVEAYQTGRFRDSFTSVTDLLPKAAAAIRAAEAGPTAIALTPVTKAIPVPWLGEQQHLPGRSTYGPSLEVHLLAVAGAALPATALEAAGQRLTRAGREAGLFQEDQAVTKGESPDAEWAGSGSPGKDVRPAGLRLARSGTVSVWRDLPSDNLGSIASVESLTQEIADLILAGARLIPTGGQVAVTAGLDPVGMLVEGDPADLGRRNSASMRRFPGTEGIRLLPESSVPGGQLGQAARDMARELASRLLRVHRSG